MNDRSFTTYKVGDVIRSRSIRLDCTSLFYYITQIHDDGVTAHDPRSPGSLIRLNQFVLLNHWRLLHHAKPEHTTLIQLGALDALPRIKDGQFVPYRKEPATSPL